MSCEGEGGHTVLDRPRGVVGVKGKVGMEAMLLREPLFQQECTRPPILARVALEGGYQGLHS